MAVKTIDFEHLLGVEQCDTFIQDFFQKRPYILHREDPHFYDGLISLADVEALTFSIKSSAIYKSGWLTIVKGNIRPQAAELFNEKGIIPSQVTRHYQQGYTLVLDNLQYHWPSIHMLCKAIEEHLSTFTYPLPFGKLDSSTYLTPPDTQGFLPHLDNVDVFILQLEGSKDWSVYNQQARFPLKVTSNLTKELGEKILAARLNPGDLLYIPAGFPHGAFTNQEYSLHLTMGLDPYRWKQIINDLAVIDEQARSPLSLEQPDASSTSTQVERLAEILQTMSSESRLTGMLKKLKGSHLTNQLPLADDYLQQINQLHDLTVDTLLRKRYDQDYEVIVTTAQISLLYPGNSISLPIEARPALYFILRNEAFAVHSIPGVEHNAAPFDLVQRLIGGGFLKTVDQAEHV